MLKKLLLLTFTTFAIPSLSLAEQNYAGGNIVFVNYSETGFVDTNVTAFSGKIGTFLSDYVSGELRAGFGVADDTMNINGEEVNFGLDSMFGAYVRGGIPVIPGFYPYAIIGFTSADLTLSEPEFSLTISDSDMSYGFGADFSIGSELAVNIEYMNYLEKNNAVLEGLSVGLIARF